MATLDDINAAIGQVSTNVANLLATVSGFVTTVASSVASTLANKNDAQAARDAANAAAAIAVSTTTNAPSYKDPVLLTSPVNLTLSGTSQTIDGVTGYGTDARILLVAQNDEAKNGIWLTKAGSWVRATDADSNAEITNMVTWALSGDTQMGREYKLVQTDAITLETTKLRFQARDYGDSEAVRRRKGTAVLVGDSNRNGRVAYYTNLPLELSGVDCPMGLWTWYNMAQNGVQLQGWRTATEASSFATAAAPADYTGVTNPYTDLYQVCKAAPDVIFFALGINDYNSVANRTGSPGTNLGKNIDWAINFLLANNPNKDGVIVLETAAPFGSIDFVAGMTTTGWGDEGLSATDNAAKYSQLLRGHYLRWKGRNPRVIVHDTAEIFNPGSTADPTLHRCDNPKVNCLDPLAARARFRGTIASNVLTVDTMYGAGSLAVGYVVTDDVYGTGSGRTIVSLGTGTGGVGTYNLSAGSDVSQRIMKIPAPLIDDSLHFSGIGARRILESWSLQAGIAFRRNVRSYTGSAMGVDPYYTILQNAPWSRSIYFGGRQQSGNNTLLSVVPSSAEALAIKGDPANRQNDVRATSMASLPMAEFALSLDDLGRVLQVANMRGSRIKMAVKGGTGTIYTASSVFRSSTGTTITFYHVLQFNDLNLTGEPTSGEMIVWVEDAGGIPFQNKSVQAVLPPGTAAVASTAIPFPFPVPTNGLYNGMQLRSIKATRFAATDGACVITVGLSNQSADNRLVDVSTTKTGTIDDGAGGSGTVLTVANDTGIAVGQTVTGNSATAGTKITGYVSPGVWTVNTAQLRASGTFTFGVATASTYYTIGTLTFSGTALTATWAPNQANIDDAVASLIGWPASGGAGSANVARLKSTYRLTLVPDITLTKPVTVTVSD